MSPTAACNLLIRAVALVDNVVFIPLCSLSVLANWVFCLYIFTSLLSLGLSSVLTLLLLLIPVAQVQPWTAARASLPLPLSTTSPPCPQTRPWLQTLTAAWRPPPDPWGVAGDYPPACATPCSSEDEEPNVFDRQNKIKILKNEYKKRQKNKICNKIKINISIF